MLLYPHLDIELDNSQNGVQNSLETPAKNIAMELNLKNIVEKCATSSMSIEIGHSILFINSFYFLTPLFLLLFSLLMHLFISIFQLWLSVEDNFIYFGINCFYHEDPDR